MCFWVFCALVFCLESQHCGKGTGVRAGGWVTLGLSFASLGQAYPLRPGLGPAHDKGISGLDKLGGWPHRQSWLPGENRAEGVLKTQREAQK